MSELYFVRHGQAAFGTGDYDRLTPLGFQQSRWLGEYFAERGVAFDRVLSGTLRRHRETVEAVSRELPLGREAETRPGLDEFRHEELHEAYLRESGETPGPDENAPRHFHRRLEQALHAWAAGRLGSGVSETWQEFTGRVAEALLPVCEGRGLRVLVVSSGGPMAATLGRVLGLTDAQAIRLNLQVRNTGFSHFYFGEEGLRLASFNSIPHLDRQGRREAITLA